MDKCHLRLAIQMTTQDGTPLCDYLVDDILRLRDLLDRAHATPAGAEWVRKALSQAATPRRPTRTTSSGSETSSSAGPRRRDEPSSGRGNSKRATLTETSDSDDRQPRHQGRHHPDKRQVTAHIFHATDDDSDAPPFPPRVFRYRTCSRRPHPCVAAPRADSPAPDTHDLPSIRKIVEAATATAIAAVDHHLAHLGLHPRPETASSHDTVHHHCSHTTPAPIAPPPPLTGLVAPTTEPSQILTHTSCPPVGSATVGRPPQIADPSGATPTHNGYPLTPRAPTPAPLQPAVPTANPAISLAPAAPGTLTHGPPDERTLCDDSPSQTSSTSSHLGLRADFVANMQAAYRTLDMCRVPRIQPLQFPLSADRTAATQLLICSMRDALSGIFDVADPTGTVTMDSPVWVSGWHAPLLKLTKAAINANRDDTYDLHRLIDDLFSQLQERLSSCSSGPAAFKILLTDFADYFDRAPRGAALETAKIWRSH